MAYLVFSAPGNNRILYDREINKMVPLNEKEFLSITGKSGKSAEVDCLERLYSKGLCLHTELENIENPATEFLHSYLERQMNELVLQVTQNCNLRCEYCVYSGSYYNRTHSHKRMSKDTALKAIDFLMAHSGDEKEVTIGFYGGEPLLEFQLIQMVIEYVQSEYGGKKIHYSMTTNGTLLTDQMVSILEKYQFHLMLSIDGPEELHNKHRRFANGVGSYKVLMDNLTEVKKRHREFYDKLSTNTVLSPDQDISVVQDYLNSDEMIGALSSRLSLISEIGAKCTNEYPDSYYSVVEEGNMKLFLHLLGFLPAECVPSLAWDYFSSLIQFYQHYKLIGNMARTAHPGGPCTPGIRRLFLDVDGYFYPCEHVSENDTMKIGNLWDGLDEQIVANFLNVGKWTESECKACWAFHYCEQCIAQCIAGTGILPEKRLANCSNVRASVFMKLRNLAFLLEQGFDFERYIG